MSILDDWLDTVADALGLERDSIDRDAVLDLTRDVAHGVARPAAPLTAYLVGLAAGRNGGTADDVANAIATTTAAVEKWTEAHPPSEGAQHDG